MRVDLYATGDDVWFGKYFAYQCGGVRKFWPKSADTELGQLWRLPGLTSLPNPTKPLDETVTQSDGASFESEG